MNKSLEQAWRGFRVYLRKAGFLALAFVLNEDEIVLIEESDGVTEEVPILPPDSRVPTLEPGSSPPARLQAEETLFPKPNPEQQEPDPREYVIRRSICPSCMEPSTYPQNTHFPLNNQRWVCECGLVSVCEWFNPELEWTPLTEL